LFLRGRDPQILDDQDLSPVAKFDCNRPVWAAWSAERGAPMMV
jgi:hypothetical protein